MTRIGVIDLRGGGWSGGENYTSVTAKSLAQATRAEHDTQICFLTSGPALPGLHHIDRGGIGDLPIEGSLRRRFGRGPRERLIPGERKLRRGFRLPVGDDPLWLAKEHDIDVLFPVMAGRRDVHRKTAQLGWIPDLQHQSLPHLFSSSQLIQRYKVTSAIASRCNAVILSSQSVADEFRKAFPTHREKARVLPFPSRYAFEAPNGSPEDVRRKYNLPERYFLCANQFWGHKNHLLIVEAVAILRRRGLRVNVVFTGLPLDTRSLSNEPISHVLQAAARHDVWSQIHTLGLVPRNDLDGLLRDAIGVVQPSEHEGWSTTVQDAKALGRPLLCSKLPVLQEQAPTAKFFKFDSDDVADKLAQAWEEPAADAAAETAALQQEAEFGYLHGQQLMTYCREVLQ